jgi:hypothetical protein
MQSEGLRTLQAELRADMTVLGNLEEKYDLIKAKLSRIEPDEFDHAALAYTIANLYNLMENYFSRVAKCFENNIEPGRWHRDLVARMALEIDGIRPALLNAADVPLIDELRAFRHVFRHIYQSQLDEEKLLLVDQRTPAALSAFRKAHDRFDSALGELIEEVDKSAP